MGEFIVSDRSDFRIVQVRVTILDDQERYIARGHQIVPDAGRHIVNLARLHLDRRQRAAIGPGEEQSPTAQQHKDFIAVIVPLDLIKIAPVK